jgi:hypothetical protein
LIVHENDYKQNDYDGHDNGDDRISIVHWVSPKQMPYGLKDWALTPVAHLALRCYQRKVCLASAK